MSLRTTSLALALALALVPAGVGAQVRIGDLAQPDGEVPLRLVGYGLVVGLDGTGDRAIGGFGARHTVQSVANLLRNFDVDVPAEVLRTRNVAAVLVTAEASPYLRPGGRVDIHVASIGDAASLRGGVLWVTPLVLEAGGRPLAVAQGPIVMSEGRTGRGGHSVETTARVPAGALVAAELPRAAFAGTSRFILREPNLTMATRIAAAIEGALGQGAARVEDPGSVALTLPAGEAPPIVLARLADLVVPVDSRPRIIVDGRDGTVVAGGAIAVRNAVVSHGGITVTVGASDNGDPVAGEVRLVPGTTIQDIAATLHAVGAPAPVIAAIFDALRSVGAITAEVTIR
jgi:flagellar P-ring protein FlgI